MYCNFMVFLGSVYQFCFFANFCNPNLKNLKKHIFKKGTYCDIICFTCCKYNMDMATLHTVKCTIYIM